MNVWVILKGNFICVLIVEVSSLKRPVETENSHLGCQMVVRWLSDKTFLRFTHSQQFNFSLVLKGQIRHADVAELADALDSGSSVLTDVEVQILSSALTETS